MILYWFLQIQRCGEIQIIFLSSTNEKILDKRQQWRKFKIIESQKYIKNLIEIYTKRGKCKQYCYTKNKEVERLINNWWNKRWKIILKVKLKFQKNMSNFSL